MGLILNIDTAIQTASICLAQNDHKIDLIINSFQKDHAAWLQPAIDRLLKDNDCKLQDLDAVAISAGPGSYTGLRVGMAAAKGLSYTLDIPLITVSTLKMMAAAAIKEETGLLCPMIDARRMEVFTAVYNRSLSEVIAPHNCILTDLSYKQILNKKSIVFFGNGSKKFKELINHNANALFKNIEANAGDMVHLSYENFQRKKYNDLAYSEPFYGKDFFSPAANLRNKI
jgi:tRNA threonylcarbamoyladenosine biosynthesis protein TsaB